MQYIFISLLIYCHIFKIYFYKKKPYLLKNIPLIIIYYLKGGNYKYIKFYLFLR